MRFWPWRPTGDRRLRFPRPSKTALRAAGRLLWDTFMTWRSDQASLISAAVAYYALFSLPPLLIATVSIAGMVYGTDVAQEELARQLTEALGPDAAAILTGLVEQSRSSRAGPWATLLGVAIVIYGGSRVFHRVQLSLNAIWEVAPPRGLDVWRFVREQLVSFVMLLGIAAVFLVSLVSGAVLSLTEGHLQALLRARTTITESTAPLEETISDSVAPIEDRIADTLAGSVEPLEQPISDLLEMDILDDVRITELLASVRSLRGFELRLTFLLSALFFAFTFKFVPNTRIAWGDVWIGAILTAILFAAGRYAISLYLTYATVTTAYGAAGSLIVIMLWVFYSAQILFFGAEFTKLYARRYGSRAASSEP